MALLGPPEEPRMASPFDERGCLTSAALEALARSEAGRVPADVAAHVAVCRPCQRRLLGRDRAAQVGRRGGRSSRLWRAAVAAITGLLVAVAVLLLLQLASG